MSKPLELMKLSPFKKYTDHDPFMQQFKQASASLRLGGQGFELDVSQVINQFITVVGIRGAGKSNGVSVLCEEMLKAKLPILIMDAKDEYFPLRDYFEDISVIREPTGATPENVAERLILENKSTIIAYPTWDTMKDVYKYSADLVMHIKKLVKEMDRQERHPFFTVLEEAHSFLPSQFPSDLESKNELKRLREGFAWMANQGRAYGSGNIICSTRMSRLETSVIAASELKFIFNTTGALDRKILANYVEMGSKELMRFWSSRPKHTALFIKDGKEFAVKFRKKRIRDVSSSPAYTRLFPDEKSGNKFDEIVDIKTPTIDDVPD